MSRKEKDKTDYAKEMQNSFEQWEYLKQHGCRDPGYADGVNMNLVRNHICYYKNKIEETFLPEQYPDIYFREMPPEMPVDYMARSDEIRERAKRSLALYKEDKNRRFLERKITTMDKKSIKNTCIENVLNYSVGLEIAIREDRSAKKQRRDSQ